MTVLLLSPFAHRMNLRRRQAPGSQLPTSPKVWDEKSHLENVERNSAHSNLRLTSKKLCSPHQGGALAFSIDNYDVADRDERRGDMARCRQKLQIEDSTYVIFGTYKMGRSIKMTYRSLSLTARVSIVPVPLPVGCLRKDASSLHRT